MRESIYNKIKEIKNLEKQEALIVNNNIEITILDIKGDQVKIGISAPKDVSIYRKEVYLQIQESNKEAMSDNDFSALADFLK